MNDFADYYRIKDFDSEAGIVVRNLKVYKNQENYQIRK